MSDKPILVLDFDGVLHSYKSGWQGADVIPDGPVDGAVEFCNRALDHFRVFIVSSRCSQSGGTEAIMEWLTKYKFPMGLAVSVDGAKPPAFITLDDRARTFNGTWPDISELLNFKPWYERMELMVEEEDDFVDFAERLARVREELSREVDERVDEMLEGLAGDAEAGESNEEEDDE